MPISTFYSGFSSHLKFSSNLENDTIKPIDGLNWSALKIENNKGVVQDVFIGWCCLFIVIDDQTVYYLGYESPIKEPIGHLCTLPDLSNDRIKSIEWGSKHSFVLTEKGSIFRWTMNVFSSPPVLFTDDHLPNNEHKNVKSISIGSKYSSILYTDGTALILSNDDENDDDTDPIAVGIKNGTEFVDEIMTISCGHEHILFLTKSGRIYSYGRGSKGQLGHGDVEDVSGSEVKLIESLDGLKIKSISAGGFHSLALSSEGDAYSWGWNESGQLAQDKSKSNVIPVPTLIDFKSKDPPNVQSVSCGSRHSMILTEDSKLYSFGWNKYCQLALDSSTANSDKAILIKEFDEMDIKKIECKFWSSVIFIDF